MITSKEQLTYYLECDRIALGKKAKKPSLFGDEIWKFQICMRKLDYFQNRGGLLRYYYKFKYHNLQLKLRFSIPCNRIGPGLAIVHYRTIVIASGCTIGNNFRIHAGVNIGANGGSSKAANIGNNVYVGPGAKLLAT